MNSNNGFGLVQGGYIPTKKKRDNPIIGENRNKGSIEWQLHLMRFDDPETLWSYPLNRRLRSSAIEGYASKTSVYQGEGINFMVSTNKKVNFTIDIYRTGYYGGVGTRHMVKLRSFKGEPKLVPMMTVERLRECNWEKCIAFKIPKEWLSGVYLAKLSMEEEFGA